MDRPPSTAARLLVAFFIALVAGAYCLQNISLVRPADDFSWYWLGARALLAGKDPYIVIQPGGSFRLDAPFIYPLTTAIAALPFAAWLTPAWAGAVFVGTSAGLLAWGITADNFARLPIFGSAPFFWAMTSGQLSPLVAAGALIPALGWLAPIKPNLGIAALAYRPSKFAMIGSFLFLLASLTINPRWPLEWINALHARQGAYVGKGIPLFLNGGPILLLALTRWRRREARLLLLLAAVPQTIMFYDQLLLWLIPRTRLQSVSMGLLSMIGLVLGNLALPSNPTHAQVATTYWPMVFATCYLPALALILRQPNQYDKPHARRLTSTRSRLAHSLGITTAA